MTTIVIDPKRKILVTDSQVSDEDAGIKYSQNKVYAVPGGWLGAAGAVVDIQKAVRWARGELKRKPKMTFDNTFVMLTGDGVFSATSALDWQSEDSPMAIGSGAMAAEAVLRLGMSAEDAVDMACQIDLRSSGPIKIYTLDDAEPIVWKKNNG
jgi:20S proteasome alpha/beta subunit